MGALLVLVPFLSIIILNLPFKAIGKRFSFGVAAILFTLQMVLVFMPLNGFWEVNPAAFGNILSFELGADILSKVLLFCIGLVSLVALFASRDFLKANSEKLNFINVLLIAFTGLNGVVLSKDIFSLYVFMEITAVASFILIAFNKDILGLEGAFKYIVLSGIASVLMIAGVALLLLVCGSTNFAVIHAMLLSQDKNILISLAIGLFLCALFIKSGLMPFHGWLPDAYTAAPAAVSIFLAGIVTKVAGVYVLIRLVISVLGFSLPVKSALLWVGAFSVILGAITALSQTDFKRMLSYSSISQVGYIILGLASGTALGLAGAALHIFNHAVFKSLLFVNAASVEEQAGTRDMDKLSGLAKQMPLTGLTSILGSLSCAGLPPLAGFWSKLMIIIALWVAGYRAYAVIAILGSILTLAYFLSLQRRVFFGVLSAEFKGVKEAGFNLIFPAVLLSALIIAAGLFTPIILNGFILSFQAALGG